MPDTNLPLVGRETRSLELAIEVSTPIAGREIAPTQPTYGHRVVVCNLWAGHHGLSIALLKYPLILLPLPHSNGDLPRANVDKVVSVGVAP